jgi:hypothetical protein
MIVKDHFAVIGMNAFLHDFLPLLRLTFSKRLSYGQSPPGQVGPRSFVDAKHRQAQRITT